MCEEEKAIQEILTHFERKVFKENLAVSKLQVISYNTEKGLTPNITKEKPSFSQSNQGLENPSVSV